MCLVNIHRRRLDNIGPGLGAGVQEIYIKEFGNGSAVRIAHKPGYSIFPKWKPAPQHSQ